MAGVVDLGSNLATLPNEFIVDSSVLVERLIAAYPTQLQRVQLNADRARQFFEVLAASQGVGIVTPTIFHEFVHFAIKIRYQIERLNNRPQLITRYGSVPDWIDLYKREPHILRQYRAELEGFCRTLGAAQIVIVQPEVIHVSRLGQRYEMDLIDVVCRYGLDSNDSALLLEADRIGVSDIVTMDKDLLRAQADFTINTWL